MHRFWWGCGLLALLATACRAPPSKNATRDASLVITGVVIVDPASGTTSAPQDVLIDGGRIATMAPAGTVSARTDIPRVDGSGRFAIPGLIDVHAHIGEGGIAPQDRITGERALRQFLRYGVTTIFVPGATGASDADFPALRQRCRSRTIECPDLYGSGSIITAPGTIRSRPSSRCQPMSHLRSLKRAA